MYKCKNFTNWQFIVCGMEYFFMLNYLGDMKFSVVEKYKLKNTEINIDRNNDEQLCFEIKIININGVYLPEILIFIILEN